MVRTLHYITLVALLICATAAFAGQHFADKGLSLDFPDEWIVLTDNDAKLATNEVKHLLGKLGGEIDFDRVAVWALDTVDDDFIENINIIVSPGRMDPDEITPDDYMKLMRNQLSDYGLKPTNMVANRETYAGTDALTLEYEADSPLFTGRIKQYQVIFSGVKNTYIITCSSSAADYATYKPVFTKTLKSAETSIKASMGGSRILKNFLIGGAVGMLFSLLGSAFKSNKKSDS